MSAIPVLTGSRIETWRWVRRPFHCIETQFWLSPDTWSSDFVVNIPQQHSDHLKDLKIILINTAHHTSVKGRRLNYGLHVCAFDRVDKVVSGGKPPAGKVVDSLLSWHRLHFWVCIKFCEVWHGDSVDESQIIINQE